MFAAIHEFINSGVITACWMPSALRRHKLYLRETMRDIVLELVGRALYTVGAALGIGHTSCFPAQRPSMGHGCSEATSSRSTQRSRSSGSAAALGSPVGFWGVPKCSVVPGSVRCSRPRTGAQGFSDGVRQRIVCHFPAGSCHYGSTFTHLGIGHSIWVLAQPPSLGVMLNR